MKRTSILLALIFGIFANIQASDKIVTDFNLNDFSKTKIVLKISFGESNILNPLAINEIKNKEIEKITLVYTTYREVDKFQQKKLNFQRERKLIKILPKADQVHIDYIGVEKCIEKDCAEKQFHGFVIEYKASLFHYSKLEIQKRAINSNIKSIVKGKQGTRFEIEPYSFEDLNGNEISGSVTIELIEAMTPVDLVKANLLTITDKGEVLESDGTIYLKAYQDCNELRLKKDKEIFVNMPMRNSTKQMKSWNGIWEDSGIAWTNPIEIQDEVLLEEKEKVLTIKDTYLFYGSHAGNYKNEYGVIPDSINNYANENPKNGHNIEKIRVYKLAGNGKQIKVKTTSQTHFFYATSYSKLRGVNEGFSEEQATIINDLFVGGNGTINKLSFWGEWTEKFPIIIRKNRLAIIGTRTFTMREMGWINLDRLSKFPPSQSANLEVVCENSIKAKNLSVTLVIPSLNINLPGYEQESGGYCFLQNAYESQFCLPKKYTAFLIITGEIEEESYSVVEKITLGENDIENVQLIQRSKENTFKLLDELM